MMSQLEVNHHSGLFWGVEVTVLLYFLTFSVVLKGKVSLNNEQKTLDLMLVKFSF